MDDPRALGTRLRGSRHPPRSSVRQPAATTKKSTETRSLMWLSRSVRHVCEGGFLRRSQGCSKFRWMHALLRTLGVMSTGPMT